MGRFRLQPGVWLAALLAAGCAHPVPLAEADRASLGREPVIHVLHYETALPVVKPVGKAAAPAATAVRHAAGADPAALVATSFSALVRKTQKLKNLRPEPARLPRPVARNATALKVKDRRGLALELWVDNWTFEPLAGVAGQYAMRFDGHARLSRLDDGRILWSTGGCRIAGAQSREFRVTARDLTSGTRVRKLLAAARSECARQLVRDFESSARR